MIKNNKLEVQDVKEHEQHIKDLLSRLQYR
jgi:hypothetical protein